MSAPDWREVFALAICEIQGAQPDAPTGDVLTDNPNHRVTFLERNRFFADAVLAAAARLGYRLHRDHDWAPAPEHDPMIVSKCRRCGAFSPGLRESASCEGGA